MSPEQFDIDRLTKSIEEATTVAHTISMQLEELRTDLTHALRNHGAEWKPTEQVKETVLRCDTCEEESTLSVAASIQSGWMDVGPDGADLIGTCPPCFAAQEDRERKLNEPPKSVPVEVPFIGSLEAGENYLGLHIVGNFKRKKDAQAAVNGSEVRGYLNGKYKRGWVVLRELAQEAVFPMEEAIAMGLTEADIEQAKAEGVPNMLGLRGIEKNTPGAPRTLFPEDQ